MNTAPHDFVPTVKQSTAQEPAGATIGKPTDIWIPPNQAVTTRSRTAVEMSRPWKSQNDFHRRLEISHTTRDSHISTSHFFSFRSRMTEKEPEANQRS